MAKEIYKELLDLFEALLRTQLNTIRQLRKEAGMEEKPQKEKRKSQVDIVYDILKARQQPMHIDVIIAQAKKLYNIELDKESIVSALSKRIKRQDRFIKTAPNTFALISQEPEGGR